MRQVFTLPDLGEGLAEAELVRWLVAVGDVIPVDHPVVEVETAKATVEVPSPFAGVVAVLHGDEGAVIDVGAPLLSVDDPAAGRSAVPSGGGTVPVAAETYVVEERAGSGNVLIGFGTSADGPAGASGGRRRRRGVTTPAALPVPVQAGPVAVRSPIVRRIARERGVDLTSVAGSGPDGLVLRSDVEAAAARSPQREPLAPPVQPESATAPEGPASAPTAVESPTGAVPPAAVDTRTGLEIAERVALKGVRKAVAVTLSRSRREIPEATTWVDVDATELLLLRASLAGPDGRGPGLLPLLARFVVAGLERFPELNSRVDEENGEILHLRGVNLGIAAQTSRGLVVPCVRAAHRMSARALDEQIRRLTAAAREGTATAAELSGGSFTLNNYGVLGVDGSAAIIHHPEVAILGMGRVLPRPWVVDDQIVVRSITQLSLVFDHRVCDGGTAGGFLRFVADAVEKPLAAFADL